MTIAPRFMPFTTPIGLSAPVVTPVPPSISPVSKKVIRSGGTVVHSHPTGLWGHASFVAQMAKPGSGQERGSSPIHQGGKAKRTVQQGRAMTPTLSGERKMLVTRLNELRFEVAAFVRKSGLSTEAKTVLSHISEQIARSGRDSVAEMRGAVRELEDDVHALKEGMTSGVTVRSASRYTPSSWFDTLVSGDDVAGVSSQASDAKITNVRFEVGQMVYHHELGLVEVLGVEVKGEQLMVQVEVLGGKRWVWAGPGKFFKAGSRRAEMALTREIDQRYRYLPEIVGLAYIMKHFERYEGVLSEYIGPVSQKHVKSLLNHSAYYLSGKQPRPVHFNMISYVRNREAWAEQIREDHANKRICFRVMPYIVSILREVHRATSDGASKYDGDDVILLGMEEFADDLSGLTMILEMKESYGIHLRRDVYDRLLWMKKKVSVAGTMKQDWRS